VLETQSSAVKEMGHQELTEIASPDGQHGPGSVYLVETNVGIRPHNCRQFFEVLYKLVQVDLSDTADIDRKKIALVEKLRQLVH
jgi:hypothetical protein